MSVDARLHNLAERLSDPKFSYTKFSEKETEQYLIEPFIDALGYDSRNPSEVQCQFPIQIGSTIRTCDYAIRINGEVRVLIEGKKSTTKLDSPGQLASYFSQIPTALVGIYTNGVEYRFYAERNQRRIKQMDNEPFLILGLLHVDQNVINKVAHCAKDELTDVEEFHKWVRDLTHMQIIYDRLRRELTGQPSDEFVRLAMQWAGVTDAAPEQINHFRRIVAEAARSLMQPDARGQSRGVSAYASAERGGDAASRDNSNTVEVVSTEWMQLTGILEPSGSSRPVQIHLPDNTRFAISSWKNVLCEVIAWLNRERCKDASGNLLTSETCHRVSLSKTRYRMSADGNRPDGKPFKSPLRVGNTGIVAESDWKAINLVRFACELTKYFNQDPSQVYLKLP